jgi:hypothetical protein
VTVDVADPRAGRHRKPTPVADRLADAAAWLVEAASVVRFALSIAAVAAVAVGILLVALPWRS